MELILKNAVKIKERGNLALFLYLKKCKQCDTQKNYFSQI